MAGAQVSDDNAILSGSYGNLIGMKEDHQAPLDLRTESDTYFRFAAVSPVAEFLKISWCIPLKDYGRVSHDQDLI